MATVPCEPVSSLQLNGRQSTVQGEGRRSLRGHFLSLPPTPNSSLTFDSDVGRFTEGAQGGLWLAKSGDLNGEMKVFRL